MTFNAYFDADGVCVGINNLNAPLSQVPNAVAMAAVSEDSEPSKLYYSGSSGAQVSQPYSFTIPETLNVDTGYVSIPLPPKTIAIVNGVVMRSVMQLDTSVLGPMFVSIRGAQYGDIAVRVVDYAAKRVAEYPSLADQLDALWKGGDAAEEMRQTIMAIKEQFPKD